MRADCLPFQQASESCGKIEPSMKNTTGLVNTAVPLLRLIGTGATGATGTDESEFGGAIEI